ncbi:hypothetical protein GOP47_0006921 [Adiantum capillus-veneris]|uniref:Acid phosphatase n=1 Tax=Adiantum capillus-veneris TaxID=13818 RepID=A0A9D4V158_ADICA|nr:hypothetical protein GOP47_0006921 [Adiantum capillus-veneris]
MASRDREDEAYPSENNLSTHSLLSREGSGYESLYGSFFGSYFSLTDGSGIYISSLALTIILSAMVFVAIALVTIVITLSVMLSACEKKHNSSLNFINPRFDSYCLSYQLNMELNNLQDLAIPSKCVSQFSNYIYGEQYLKDSEAVISSTRDYLKGLVADNIWNFTVVLDIDETTLSNFLSSRESIETYVDFISAATWTDESELTPLVPMLNLYLELSAANWSMIFLSERPASAWNVTSRNLLAAGYRGWEQLILRSEDEAGMTVEEYKSRKRAQLEEEGYQIKAVIGDQWSDLTGSATSAARMFKLPNPVYHIM